jgi:hypothetical protein
VRLAVLVTIREEKRRNPCDGGVVRGRGIELEEVEGGERCEE